MASTTTLNEMSFSCSRARRAAMSMSMSGVLPVELGLHERGDDVPIAESSGLALGLDVHALVVGLADASLDRRVVGERHAYEPARVATPVPRLGERSVDAARGDLERVGLRAHDVGGVERVGQCAGGLRDVVDADAAIGVDGDAEYAAFAAGA